MKNEKFRKNQKKSKGKVSEAKREHPGRNDVSWYTKNAELVDSAARIPFAYQPGRQIPLELGYTPTTLEPGIDTTFDVPYPGLMVLRFTPTYGNSRDLRSPMNVAARELYGRVRSKYSGSLEADAPDMLMYIMALDSMYMIYEEMKRVYYLINQYTPYNNYYPKRVIEAMGYNFEDLLENKVYLYQTIVEFGAMLNKFMVPDDMPLFKRHSFMCANIYADSADVKAQHYIFVPSSVPVLTNTDTMTELAYAPYLNSNNNSRTVNSMRDFAFEMINSLMEWDTGYTILGYFERAFEGSNFLAVSPILEDGILSPIYNPEVLIQIQNATIFPVYPSPISQDPARDNLIYQSLSAQTETPSPWVVETWLPANVLLNFPNGMQPTSADLIEATRLTTVWANDGDTPSVDAGTEVLVRMEIYLDVTKTAPAISVGTTNIPVAITQAGGEIEFPDNVLRLISALSSFAYHPLVTIWTHNEGFDESIDAEDPFAYGIEPLVFGELTNFTQTDVEVITNLHRMCVYSEFNCFKRV